MLNWESLVIALAVLAAAAYLGRNAWRAMRAKAGNPADVSCGGCSSCGANEEDRAPQKLP